MKTRIFGRSGIQVPELVFGGGFVGGLLLHADDETKRQAIARALEAGIDWIDTAPMYGGGESEKALGWLLSEVETPPRISTKVYLDLENLDDIAGQVERSLETSLSLLQMEKVELLQLHNAIGPETGNGHLGVDDVLRRGGALDAIEAMRDQGLAKLIGMTALGQAPSCVQVLESGRLDAAQVYYNLLNPSAGYDMPAAWRGHDFGGIIAACRRHGVAVMNIRVFAAGVIATDVRHGREMIVTEDTEMAEEERRARAVFADLGAEYGTRAQTAIRFSLANPDISCVIFGLAELDHLEQALGATEKGPLPADALDRLDRLYASNFGAD
ncbi:MAG: aldo/keto reductase [Alphaproteobacteria bacterium]|jgi:L-galactose dehydrogenase/L-glyceraldehyde 3-phosphate reductase|nr:aldo/keto reductase [Alphaproteobacteria bacterium]